MKTDPNKVRL